MQPAAQGVAVRLIASGDVRPMGRVDREGLFEVHVPAENSSAAAIPAIPDYRLVIDFGAGQTIEIDDPFRYGRLISDYDLHLFAEGTHQRIQARLGAHRLTVGTTVGIHFAVWAPNADRVSVVGDFNGWDGRMHPMRLLVPG